MQTSRKAWRWTRFRRGLRALILRDGKEKAWTFVEAMIMNAAKNQRWRDSETVATIASRHDEFNEVCRRMEGER